MFTQSTGINHQQLYIAFSQVIDMKESIVMLSSPVPASRRSVTKIQEQQGNLAPASASAAETPVSGSDAMENGNNQDGEGTQPFLQCWCCLFFNIISL